MRLLYCVNTACNTKKSVYMPTQHFIRVIGKGTCFYGKRQLYKEGNHKSEAIH
jgi:hypothetical protein